MRRTAIVTGARHRVGRAICEALLGRGWRVVAHVRGEGDAVAEGAHKVVADLAEPDAAPRIIDAAGGHIDLLVNNAARFQPDSLADFSAGEFDAHMAVNLKAPVALTQVLAAKHEAGRDAAIVNILDAKLAAPNPDFLSYTLAKAGLAGLTEIAARALAGKGIRVNAISPALMLQSLGQDEAGFASVHAANLLGRGVEPDELVDALLYLADARSVTGQTIILDGGQRFMALPRDVQYMEQQ
ncbi:SDR family oxidoreductase [Sphingomicrobium flavum]|uniref:SDR family oxidoreductase n=1 Tax=Sphingomicrobium flavum TaxID=1229164 RepID=UPI0021ADC18C|nr:SDR family oxidoreductase [Sphingomicrobium flavum]